MGQDTISKKAGQVVSIGGIIVSQDDLKITKSRAACEAAQNARSATIAARTKGLQDGKSLKRLNSRTPQLARRDGKTRRGFAADPFRAGLVASTGLVLFGLVLMHSFVAYLARTAPEAALVLRPDDSAALVAQAEKKFNRSALDAKSLLRLHQELETALRANPLDARALRLLAEVAESSKAPNAEDYLRLAARLSYHEPLAVERMMQKSFQNKDYSGAASYADALLRTRPELLDDAMPLLGRMAEDENAKSEIDKLLASNPPWRPLFFRALDTAITDARTPLALFGSLKNSVNPPTAEELNGYLLFLTQRKLYNFAYRVWLEFLPASQLEGAGYLFNGSFASRPSGSPFDWTIGQGTGVVVEIAPRPDANDKHALLVEFGPGRVIFPEVVQTVMLPAGGHRFKGRMRGEVIGRRGIQWSIYCVGGATIGESAMMLGSYPPWRDFDFDFVVPATGCPALLVRLSLLARSASEQLVSGSIWFADLSISPRMDGSLK